MSLNRTLGNLGKAIDSATAGTFLQRDDAADVDFVSIAYSDLSGTPTSLDSAGIVTLIDSAYIQLRQGSLGGGGLDSAALTALVDSNYVSARTSNLSSGFFMYDYVATAGQTTFQDSDANGNVLSFGNGGILVFYNGILMRRGSNYDYIEGTNSITLNTAADSAANITISKWTYSGGQPDGIVWGGDRGVSAGAHLQSNVIEYFDITSPGNASDFGDLTVSRSGAGDASNSTIGLFMGGYANPNTDTIDYITFATTGNATDFGDLTVAVTHTAGVSDGTYGVKMGGISNINDTSTITNVIDYVTIASPGNATDFGDLSSVRRYAAGANDFTRGLLAGGQTTGGSYVNSIEYITIASPSNSLDFGDLSANSYYSSGTADATYSVICLGYTPSAYTNAMEYVTTQTTSNSSDFGDLNVTKAEFAATSNGTYGVFAGGDQSGLFNSIEYITIASPGNGTDFGDLTTAVYRNAGSSGSPS